MGAASSAHRALRKDFGRALGHYEMLSDGDRVLVALSGGKDSLTLLWMLDDLRRRAPIHYTLHPVHIDPGFPGGYADALTEFAAAAGFAPRVEHTDYGVVSHSEKNRENPCFLCSRLRRKRLFEIADELDCPKIALGHHKDDLIETFFLNILYSGETSTMMPVQSFFHGRFRVIRPLAFSGERDIRAFARAQGFPDFINPCPSSGTSKRSEIKQMLNQLYRSNRKIRGNIFRAMSHVKPEYLLKP